MRCFFMKIVVINRKKILGTLAIIMGMLLLSNPIPNLNRAVAGNTVNHKGFTVAIDPGHGGLDPGAVSKAGLGEKDINLNIALEVKRLIESVGGKVIMTRESDVGLYSETGSVRNKKNEDLRKRKEILNGEGVDLFVSIHLNSFKMANLTGAQTFFMPNNEVSKGVADSIQSEMKIHVDENNKRVANVIKDVYIMKDCKVPGVIVECGFLSNVMEEKKLQEKAYQDKLAWSIFTGIYKYYAQQ